MTYQRWDTVSSYLVDNLYERINNGEFPEGSKLQVSKNSVKNIR